MLVLIYLPRKDGKLSLALAEKKVRQKFKSRMYFGSLNFSKVWKPCGHVLNHNILVFVTMETEIHKSTTLNQSDHRYIYIYKILFRL